MKQVTSSIPVEQQILRDRNAIHSVYTAHVDGAQAPFPLRRWRGG